ncbi:MAG: sigma 54-interacting transcriptional regulator [Firmicutes bacterium]|nr:sigma 54-interacting transcriptional regulator [Bacillota bacterium]
MPNKYGKRRVLEPQHVLPTSAWKLDNNRNIYPDELRVSIKRIHLEGTGFKQICTESNNDDKRIKQNIIDIIIRRGKLHNPISDTGGLVMGVVEEIGKDYDNQKGLKVGDLVICNASAASMPMYIEDIISVDKAFHQVEAKGYVIVHNLIPVVKAPEDMPHDILMFAFDQSGTPFRLKSLIGDKKKFLIVGDSMITNLLYGYVIRRELGVDCVIKCLLDKRSNTIIAGKGIDDLISEVFDEVSFLDILKPVECMEKIGEESLYDLSVNCAEIPGAETINILATKPGGTVLFANLINNLNIALYITESLSKSLDVRGAEGYLEGYNEFDVELVKELAPYFENVQVVEHKADAEEEDKIESPYVQELIGKTLMEDFVFRSKAMIKVLEDMTKVSKYDCNVLIFGDTGVGKEKAANIIQKNSERRLQPFVKINCGAISPSLIESEFFGYEKGAFTGASNTGKKGYFELANNGVMFLDEIGELPLEMQAKLLRVIQDGEFYRVGGTTPVKTNVRIISATNRNLEKFVEEGKFRRDLYYRLNVVPIKIPSLEERPEDIPVLVNHFLSKYNKKFGVKRGISDSAMEYLKQQQWPGNIRELENTVQRLMIGAGGEDITLMDVMKDNHSDIMELDAPGADNGLQQEIDLQKAVDEYEKGLIKYACEKYGSTRKAAKAIGISQTQLVRKKKKYEL